MPAAAIQRVLLGVATTVAVAFPLFGAQARFIDGFLAQCSTVGPGTCTEIVSAAYARQSVGFATPTSGRSVNATPFTFGSNGVPSIAGHAVYDAPTGGNLLLVLPLASPAAFGNGVVDAGDVGTLAVIYTGLSGVGDGSAFVGDFAAASVLGTSIDGSVVTTGSGLSVNHGAAQATSNAAVSRAAQTLSRPSRSFVRTSQFMGDDWAATPVNGTIGTLLTTEDDFDLVRFVFGNDTAAVSVVNNVIFAPTAAPNDGVNPIDGSGAAVPWKQVTFNGNGADLTPSQTPTGATIAISIPASSNANVPTRVFSDWMRVSSLPRSDGGAQRLLMFRQYTATGGTSRTPFAQSTMQPWLAPTTNKGRIEQSYVMFNVDAVSVPAAFTASVPYWFVAPLAMQYYGRTRGVTLAVYGDSITAGAHSQADRTGWPFLAMVALSTPTRPVQLFNQGWSGQTGPNIYLNAMATVPIARPDVVCVVTWTPNDQPPTQATADLSWAHAIEVAELARSTGAVPILVTPIPSNGLTVAQDAIRLGIVARTNAAAASGALVVDMNAVVSDGATPAHILPAFDSGDHIHPNDAGYAAMARAANPVILRALTP